ncbi:MAG: sugar ABC transporter ATP-binding protein [Cellulomonas iranensis]|nr:sugar ABC transporter ATP-binding protein [Cellulomonas iranensis]MBO9569784.1 sugar ABC transporter ATP-binding protein [Cellulomonas iranensis]
MENAPLLRMAGVKKAFAGTIALSQGDLTVQRGEVHALMGQNGAGKSTLIKALTGVVAPDAGTIELDGEPVAFRSPHDAQRGGVSPIYQEINLVGLRTIAENVFLGKELRRGPFLARRAMEEQAAELLRRVGVSADPRLPLESVSTATQQMVAIARALSFESRLLIMDEPTSSLHDREVDTLFEVISGLRDDGVSVVFVSHKLDELYRICDTVTILRDGRTVRSGSLREISRIELVSTMLGRAPETIETAGQTAFVRAGNPDASAPVLLDVRNVASGDLCRDASFTLHAGEVVGVAGLLGSGRSELAGAVYGAQPRTAGDVELDGVEHAPGSARDGLRAGLALTPEDRKVTGLVGQMSIAENVTLSILDRVSRWGVVDEKAEAELVGRYVKRLGIKASGQDQPVDQLSGGNQQKVLLARSLASTPRVLILDEPTRGVDVGAKQEIQRLVSELVAEKKDVGVLMISSEMEEIIEGSNRIMVMRDGVTVAFLDAGSVTNGQLMMYMASGGARESAEVA